MAATTGLNDATAAPIKATPPTVLVAPVCAVPAVVIAVVLALVGVPIWAVVVAAVVVAVVFGAWLIVTSDKVARGGLVLRDVHEADYGRLFNMVEGLCDSHGFRRPALHVIDNDARNAVVYGRNSDHATLAVTRGWLDSLSRMGLEGLLARELALANSASLPTVTVAASVARVLPGAVRTWFLQRVLGEHRLILDDFEAVRLTRYPPGLAEALVTQQAGSPVVAGAAPTSGHLWVTPPGRDSVSVGHAISLDLRVDALREL